MHRARQQSLIAALVLAPHAAWAWHAGSMFDAQPGAGGGGRVWYVGLAADKRWDCTACHLDPPGDIDVSITTVPPGLVDGAYVPGQVYAFTVDLENEGRGLNAPAANQNSLVLVVTDESGAPIGTLGGTGQFFFRNPNRIASDGLDTGNTHWTFSWTAPAAGTGRALFHIGVVDGDGAGGGSPTTQDPENDDVWMRTITADQGSAATGGGSTARVWPAAATLVLLVAALRPARQKFFSSESSCR